MINQSNGSKIDMSKIIISNTTNFNDFSEELSMLFKNGWLITQFYDNQNFESYSAVLEKPSIKIDDPFLNENGISEIHKAHHQFYKKFIKIIEEEILINKKNKKK